MNNRIIYIISARFIFDKRLAEETEIFSTDFRESVLSVRGKEKNIQKVFTFLPNWCKIYIGNTIL